MRSRSNYDRYLYLSLGAMGVGVFAGILRTCFHLSFGGMEQKRNHGWTEEAG